MRALLLLLTLSSIAVAGVCTGSVNCRACVTCKSCRYCNSGKGSCNVAREQADREYLQRQKARREKPAR